MKAHEVSNKVELKRSRLCSRLQESCQRALAQAYVKAMSQNGHRPVPLLNNPLASIRQISDPSCITRQRRHEPRRELWLWCLVDRAQSKTMAKTRVLLGL